MGLTHMHDFFIKIYFEGDHKVDICDDDAIDIIYTDVVKNNVAKLVAQYPQYECQYLWNLFDMGRNSNEFHLALYFENADRHPQ